MRTNKQTRSEIQQGDRVAFSVRWLRSTSTFTGNIPHARGIVRSINAVGSSRIAFIDWDLDDVPKHVNANNLTTVDRIHIDAALNT